MEKLAIFDIDYTITRKETLMEFFKYIVSKDIKNIKFLPRALYSGAMYGIKVFDERRVKECFLKFIENIDEAELAKLTKSFYDERISKILYKDAVEITEKQDEKSIVFEVKVANEDMGKVIGRQGRLAKSIRTLMKAFASKEHKKVSVEFIG